MPKRCSNGLIKDCFFVSFFRFSVFVARLFLAIFLVMLIAAMLVLLLTVASGCYVFPAEAQDPCLSRQCRYGARCVPSQDGLSARCQCPESCPSFGDHTGSRAVCGSDGVDYPDLCHLNLAACRQSRDIQIKYQGKCGEYSSFFYY